MKELAVYAFKDEPAYIVACGNRGLILRPSDVERDGTPTSASGIAEHYEKIHSFELLSVGQKFLGTDKVVDPPNGTIAISDAGSVFRYNGDYWINLETMVQSTCSGTIEIVRVGRFK